jgi:hypothetical protein
MSNYGWMMVLLAIASGFAPTASATAAECTPGPVPASWTGPTVPVQQVPAATPNAMTLIMFRHGEKRIVEGKGYLENGNMSQVGERRAQRLPERLLSMFGCPDYLIAPDPSTKLGPRDAPNTFFFYVRPAGTIEPTAATLSFPLWLPYGFNNGHSLANDLLTAPEFSPSAAGPRKAFIAWEHLNIEKIAQYVLKQWGLKLSGNHEKIVINGNTYACQDGTLPTWPSCDYDSIWVLSIKGKKACFAHLHQGLDDPAYQESCRQNIPATK